MPAAGMIGRRGTGLRAASDLRARQIVDDSAAQLAVGRRGRAGRGLPGPEPGAGSAGPGAVGAALIHYGLIRQFAAQGAAGCESLCAL